MVRTDPSSRSRTRTPAGDLARRSCTTSRRPSVDQRELRQPGPSEGRVGAERRQDALGLRAPAARRQTPRSAPIGRVRRGTRRAPCHPGSTVACRITSVDVATRVEQPPAVSTTGHRRAPSVVRADDDPAADRSRGERLRVEVHRPRRPARGRRRAAGRGARRPRASAPAGTTGCPRAAPTRSPGSPGSPAAVASPRSGAPSVVERSRGPRPAPRSPVRAVVPIVPPAWSVDLLRRSCWGGRRARSAS